MGTHEGNEFQIQGTCAEFDNEIDCENETPLVVGSDPFATVLGYNYTCLWNTTTSTCIRLTCGDFHDETTCMQFSDEEFNSVCDWTVIDTGDPSDLTSICYNDCPKLYEIVFTIDTSLSVTNADPENRFRQRDTLLAAMRLVWELSKLQNDVDEAGNAEKCKFALVTYSGDNPGSFTTVEFDLNNDFQSYGEYFNLVVSIFETLEYMDGTPTAPALTESVRIFEESPFDRNDPTLRSIEALITDGRANQPATAASPCEESEYSFPDQFSELNVFFYGMFVTDDADRSQFTCFEDHEDLAVNFLEFEEFAELEATFQIFTTEVCQGPYALPTEAPTLAPTPGFVI